MRTLTISVVYTRYINIILCISTRNYYFNKKKKNKGSLLSTLYHHIPYSLRIGKRRVAFVLWYRYSVVILSSVKIIELFLEIILKDVLLNSTNEKNANVFNALISILRRAERHQSPLELRLCINMYMHAIWTRIVVLISSWTVTRSTNSGVDAT